MHIYFQTSVVRVLSYPNSWGAIPPRGTWTSRETLRKTQLGLFSQNKLEGTKSTASHSKYSKENENLEWWDPIDSDMRISVNTGFHHSSRAVERREVCEAEGTRAACGYAVLHHLPNISFIFVAAGHHTWLIPKYSHGWRAGVIYFHTWLLRGKPLKLDTYYY